ncbi:DUF3015 domain-containing protein [Alkalilimnicola ehrlichii]|nr:DUF3015 domain-containing protein [Alkalilimnicola ehrlichii]
MGTAHAENTGCGLGTMVWDGQSGIAPQVLAVTTNGISGNQTFGITSGTLGCSQDGVVESSEKLAMFTGSNIDALARDMATGEGESLHVLADLMGIEDADKPAFFAMTRDNFEQIFRSNDVTAEDVLAALNDTLADDAALSRYAA